MDDNIRDLLNAGVVEAILNLLQCLALNPTCSFLPHMPTFKPHKQTTKCRIVFLSNLCGKTSDTSATVSRNQAMHSGPCINQKLTVAMILLRFDPFLLCFDLKMAKDV